MGIPDDPDAEVNSSKCNCDSCAGKEVITLSNELITKVNLWLGVDGIEHFRTLDADDVLISVHILGGGMAVRNFLRDQPECKDWGDHSFDNNWQEVVRRAISSPKATG